MSNSHATYISISSISSDPDSDDDTDEDITVVSVHKAGSISSISTSGTTNMPSTLQSSCQETTVSNWHHFMKLSQHSQQHMAKGKPKRASYDGQKTTSRHTHYPPSIPPLTPGKLTRGGTLTEQEETTTRRSPLGTSMPAGCVDALRSVAMTASQLTGIIPEDHHGFPPCSSFSSSSNDDSDVDRDNSKPSTTSSLSTAIPLLKMDSRQGLFGDITRPLQSAPVRSLYYKKPHSMKHDDRDPNRRRNIDSTHPVHAIPPFIKPECVAPITTSGSAEKASVTKVDDFAMQQNASLAEDGSSQDQLHQYWASNQTLLASLISSQIATTSPAASSAASSTASSTASCAGMDTSNIIFPKAYAALPPLRQRGGMPEYKFVGKISPIMVDGFKYAQPFHMIAQQYHSYQQKLLHYCNQEHLQQQQQQCPHHDDHQQDRGHHDPVYLHPSHAHIIHALQLFHYHLYKTILVVTILGCTRGSRPMLSQAADLSYTKHLLDSHQVNGCGYDHHMGDSGDAGRDDVGRSKEREDFQCCDIPSLTDMIKMFHQVHTMITSAMTAHICESLQIPLTSRVFDPPPPPASKASPSPSPSSQDVPSPSTFQLDTPLAYPSCFPPLFTLHNSSRRVIQTPSKDAPRAASPSFHAPTYHQRLLGLPPSLAVYILTHFHSDHYDGLDTSYVPYSSYARRGRGGGGGGQQTRGGAVTLGGTAPARKKKLPWNHGPILTGLLTAQLTGKQFNVSSIVHGIPFNRSTLVFPPPLDFEYNYFISHLRRSPPPQSQHQHQQDHHRVDISALHCTGRGVCKCNHPCIFPMQRFTSVSSSHNGHDKGDSLGSNSPHNDPDIIVYGHHHNCDHERALLNAHHHQLPVDSYTSNNPNNSHPTPLSDLLPLPFLLTLFDANHCPGAALMHVVEHPFPQFDHLDIVFLSTQHYTFRSSLERTSTPMESHTVMKNGDDACEVTADAVAHCGEDVIKTSRDDEDHHNQDNTPVDVTRQTRVNHHRYSGHPILKYNMYCSNARGPPGVPPASAHSPQQRTTPLLPSLLSPLPRGGLRSSALLHCGDSRYHVAMRGLLTPNCLHHTRVLPTLYLYLAAYLYLFTQVTHHVRREVQSRQSCQSSQSMLHQLQCIIRFVSSHRHSSPHCLLTQYSGSMGSSFDDSDDDDGNDNSKSDNIGISPAFNACGLCTLMAPFTTTCHDCQQQFRTSSSLFYGDASSPLASHYHHGNNENEDDITSTTSLLYQSDLTSYLRYLTTTTTTTTATTRSLARENKSDFDGLLGPLHHHQYHSSPWHHLALQNAHDILCILSKIQPSLRCVLAEAKAAKVTAEAEAQGSAKGPVKGTNLLKRFLQQTRPIYHRQYTILAGTTLPPMDRAASSPDLYLPSLGYGVLDQVYIDNTYLQSMISFDPLPLVLEQLTNAVGTIVEQTAIPLSSSSSSLSSLSSLLTVSSTHTATGSAQDGSHSSTDTSETLERFIDVKQRKPLQQQPLPPPEASETSKAPAATNQQAKLQPCRCLDALKPIQSGLLILIGSYSIGKERIAYALHHHLKRKIYVSHERYEKLQFVDNPWYSSASYPALNPQSMEALRNPVEMLSPRTDLDVVGTTTTNTVNQMGWEDHPADTLTGHANVNANANVNVNVNADGDPLHHDTTIFTRNPLETNIHIVPTSVSSRIDQYLATCQPCYEYASSHHVITQLPLAYQTHIQLVGYKHVLFISPTGWTAGGSGNAKFKPLSHSNMRSYFTPPSPLPSDCIPSSSLSSLQKSNRQAGRKPHKKPTPSVVPYRPRSLQGYIDTYASIATSATSASASPSVNSGQGALTTRPPLQQPLTSSPASPFCVGRCIGTRYKPFLFQGKITQANLREMEHCSTQQQPQQQSQPKQQQRWDKRAQYNFASSPANTPIYDIFHAVQQQNNHGKSITPSKIDHDELKWQRTLPMCLPPSEIIYHVINVTYSEHSGYSELLKYLNLFLPSHCQSSKRLYFQSILYDSSLIRYKPLYLTMCASDNKYSHPYGSAKLRLQWILHICHDFIEYFAALNGIPVSVQDHNSNAVQSTPYTPSSPLQQAPHPPQTLLQFGFIPKRPRLSSLPPIAVKNKQQQQRGDVISSSLADVEHPTTPTTTSIVHNTTNIHTDGAQQSSNPSHNVLHDALSVLPSIASVLLHEPPSTIHLGLPPIVPLFHQTRFTPTVSISIKRDGDS